MNLPTTPRVFVRFGNMEGEIWVKKGDFRGDLGGFWGVWTLFGNQRPHPPTFGKGFPKKNGFFFGSFPNNKRHHLHHRNITMWEAQKEKSSFEVGSEREKMGRLILCSSLITLSSREIFPLLNFSADQCFISIYTKQITFRNFISLFVCWNIWQTFKHLHISHYICDHCNHHVIIDIALSSLPLTSLPPLPLPIQVVPSSQYLRCCPAPLTHSGYHWDQMIVTQLRSNLMLILSWGWWWWW